MRKLSEVKDSDVIYISAKKYMDCYMTKEEFLESFQYDVWLEDNQSMELFEVETFYYEKVNPENILMFLRKGITCNSSYEQSIFDKTVSNNICLKYLSDVVNKALLLIPLYEKANEKIEIDIFPNK